MSVHTFDELLSHAGHKIECVYYGTEHQAVNTAIECVTCGMVLIDLSPGQTVGVDDESKKFNIGGLDVSEEVYALVKEFSRKRNKIRAVKAIKEHSGLGLRESKAIVDAYWEKNGFTYDNKPEEDSL